MPVVRARWVGVRAGTSVRAEEYAWGAGDQSGSEEVPRSGDARGFARVGGC
jgi:hypothetical protein